MPPAVCPAGIKVSVRWPERFRAMISIQSSSPRRAASSRFAVQSSKKGVRRVRSTVP